jgi:DNA-nicking Smr family endonuclease
MVRQSSDDKYRPFENLDKLLKKARQSNQAPKPKPADTRDSPAQQPLDDTTLFQQAMVGVKRLPKARQVEKRISDHRNVDPPCNPDQEAYRQLQHLVETGQGFRVCQTAEYVEGSGEPINPAILARLHQGEFAIQDYIDLHGLSLEEAMQQMDAFIKYALTRRRKAILIVHGRGLSSPAEPVLKTAVIKRINSGAWRKWIVAYASARLCDGGAGATYVLLRDYPRSKMKISQRKSTDQS